MNKLRINSSDIKQKHLKDVNKELLEYIKVENQDDFIKYINGKEEKLIKEVLHEVKQKDAEELIKEVFNEVLNEVLKERKAETELYDEIKHISSNKYFNEKDFDKEEDFDEINDKLFNKIKNILLKTKNIDDLNSILTARETIEEKEILIEKIIRISIVLLHDHHQKDDKEYQKDDKEYQKDDKEYHDTILIICNLLLNNTSEKLKKNIRIFYKFTTGNELRLQ